MPQMLSMNLNVGDSGLRKQPKLAANSVICTLGGMALHTHKHTKSKQANTTMVDWECN